MNSIIVRGAAFEDIGLPIMARMVTPEGELVTQADVISVTLHVFDMSNADEETENSTLTVSDVIFDELQTNRLWQADSDGFNFRHYCPGTAFPTAMHKYRIQYEVHLTSGEVVPLFLEMTAEKTL